MKYAKGSLSAVHALRFEPGEDVMASLQAYCEEHHIGHGTIVSGVGSLEGCSFFDPSEISGKPGLYQYGASIELPCPIELISLNGIICTDQDGNPPCTFMRSLRTSMAGRSAVTLRKATGS